LGLDKNSVVLKVSNSGPKISKKIARKIFDPFFTTKKEKHGTGLGLSVSKNLAEANQGQLEYVSDLPNTVFLLTLKKAKSKS